MRNLVAVVPGYHLVWYNVNTINTSLVNAVVPGYHLVWYNNIEVSNKQNNAVVPGYHLVWYNSKTESTFSALL